MWKALLMVSALGLINCEMAHAADDAATTAQRGLAKAQFMLRQATSEKEGLQTQVDSLQKQIDALTKQLAEAKTTATDNRQKLEEKFNGSIAQWKEHDEKINQQVAGVRDQLKDQTQQRIKLEEALKKQSDNFALCYTNNKKLVDLDHELLTQYQNKGVFDAMKQKEPFTGIKQVEVENYVQDAQYKLDGLNLGLNGVKAPE